MENRWRGSLQFLIGIGLAILFFYMMAPFVVAILLGAVLAIICYPVYTRLTRYLPRVMSAMVVMLAVVGGVLLPSFFIIYTSSYKVLGLISSIKLPSTGMPAQNLLDHIWIKKALTTVSTVFPVDKIWVHNQAQEILGSILEKISRMIAGFLGGMPGLLLGFFVMMMGIFFLLLDGAKFLRFLGSISPMRVEKSFELYHAFEKSCRGVVVGLFMSAIVQGLLMIIFLLITGMPNPFLLGAVTVVLSMVPIFGSAPVSIGAVIYLFVQDHPAMGIVMIVGGVLIAASDNVVRPMVMRGQSEMHPLLALVSVFGAVDLLGPTGIFLGPIIAAVFVSFLKITSQEIRREKSESVNHPG